MITALPGRLLSILVVAPLLAGALRADQAATSEPQITSYLFLEAVIESLSRSHAALTLVNNKIADPSPVEQMTAIQNAGIELSVAAGHIQPFSAAANENVRESTSSTLNAYTTIQRSLVVALAVAEKLNTAKTEDDLVVLRRQISDAKVLNQQGTLILIDATGMAFLSCLVPDPKDPANHVALNMTPAERARLLKQLQARFGPPLKRQKSDDDTGPLQAARTLRAFLEKKWRFAP